MPFAVYLHGAMSVSALSLLAQRVPAISSLPKLSTKMWAHSQAAMVRAWACDRRVEA